MNQKIKDYLGIAIIVAVLAVGYAGLVYVDAFSKSIQPSSFRSFSVSGEGKSVVVPDVAEFTFSVITQGGKDIAAIQKENSGKSNKAIAYLKKMGVEEKDIKTQNYDVQPQYESYNCGGAYPLSAGVGTMTYPASDISPRPCPAPKITGYTINQTVNVKLRDFAKIGDALSGVVDNGANSVSQLSFTVDDQTKPQDDARAEAIAKAKQKAESIARAGGFRLGRLLSIDEGGYYPQQPYPNFRSAVGLGGDMEKSAPPTIAPGSQDVNVSVTLRYEIN